MLLSRRYAKELQLDLIRRVMTFIYEISCLLVYRIHYLMRRLNKNVPFCHIPYLFYGHDETQFAIRRTNTLTIIFLK